MEVDMCACPAVYGKVAPHDFAIYGASTTEASPYREVYETYRCCRACGLTHVLARAGYHGYYWRHVPEGRDAVKEEYSNG